MCWMMVLRTFSDCRMSFFSVSLRRLLSDTSMEVEKTKESFFSLIWMISCWMCSDKLLKLTRLLLFRQYPLNQLQSNLSSRALFSFIYLNSLKIYSIVCEQFILRIWMNSSYSFQSLNRKMKFQRFMGLLAEQLFRIYSSKFSSMFSRIYDILGSFSRENSFPMTGSCFSTQGAIFWQNFASSKH